MRHVPDTNELRMIFKLQQLLLAHLARKIHPTDHAHKPVGFFSHAEYPAILFDIVLRLHKDTLAHTRGVEMRLEVARQIIAPNGLEIRAIQPRVIKGLAQLPEMLMGINHVAPGSSPSTYEYRHSEATSFFWSNLVSRNRPQCSDPD